MDAAETPRRRRRAARRAAGPPAQVSTTPIAELPDDGEPAAAVDGNTAAAVSDLPTRTQDADLPTQVQDADSEPVHEVVHGSPGAAPTGPSHAQGPQRDRPDRRPGTALPAGEPARRTGRTSREEASERSLRSLVTTRSTQVSPTAALRAREVALPSAADLAAAEESLVMVRRHYVPPTVLAAGRRPDRTGRRPSGQDG